MVRMIRRARAHRPGLLHRHPGPPGRPAQRWRTVGCTAPHDTAEVVPLSDGGPGFVEVLSASLDGQVHGVVVSDPMGRPVPATVLIPGTTAYLESAQAAGLHLLAPAERDPTRTTTFGVGELIRAALDLGARRIVVGLGGSGTNDAGAGLLAALGVGRRDHLAVGGLAWPA